MRHTVPMRDGRARAGRAIRARRQNPDLEYNSQAQLAKAAGVGLRMVAAAETGERVGDRTKARIERALAWPEGTIDDIINGGEPPADDHLARIDERPRLSGARNTPEAAHAAMLISIWQDEGFQALHKARQKLRAKIGDEAMDDVNDEFQEQVAALREQEHVQETIAPTQSGQRTG